MRDINQLLEEMGRADADLEKEEKDLTELEKYRIYKRTMEKIGEIDELDISEERENTEKEHFWKRVSKPAVAVAAAAVVCMVSVTAYAAFGLDDNIKHFFHIQDKQTEREIEQMVSQVDIKSESNGVTVATSQIIGDKTRFYTVLSATGLPDVPYELEFENTELTVSGANGETYDYTMQEPSMGIVADNKTKFGLLVSGINKDGEDIDVNGKNISLQLSNIGYYENGKKFVTLVKGEWKLNWVFYTQADNEKIDVNKEINFLSIMEALYYSQTMSRDMNLYKLKNLLALSNANLRIHQRNREVVFTSAQCFRCSNRDTLHCLECMWERKKVERTPVKEYPISMAGVHIEVEFITGEKNV